MEKFQTAAKKLLSKNVEDVEELNKVIETGSGLDVDLPELEELKQKSKQVCTKVAEKIHNNFKLTKTWRLLETSFAVMLRKFSRIVHLTF